MSRPNDATLAQIAAADPASSTWVSANAGSGKTKVLTDRVARLLLANVPPERILCLTYTKAAAAHMQNKLFERLGSWAMLGDADLAQALVELGDSAGDLDAVRLRHARTLFARALETPGGLKIQTIHSFCASLLRRFPVEAGVSPQFQEMDERSGRKLRADILEAMADGPARAAFDAMATYLSGDDPDKLAQEIAGKRDLFQPGFSAAEIRAALGLAEGYDLAAYLGEVLPDWAAEVLGDLVGVLRTGLKTDIKNADKLAALNLARPDMALAQALEDMFVYGAKVKAPHTAKLDSFPTKGLREAHPDLIDAVQDLMQRFEAAKPRRIALMAALKAEALNQFAAAFLPEYDRLKLAQGWLDFDDLIGKARALLTDASMAQWVLFRLDGGIDHILVDEAQDTSPGQWAVIARLAEEFFAGQGARQTGRTLFVVGDEKQSIYSFQGADPAVFGDMRDFFAAKLAEANSALNRHDLLYSFRSSVAILSLVDMVVQAGGMADVAVEITHKAFHENLPGRVDLWEFIDKPEAEERGDWFDPVDTPPANDPALMLAGQVADAVQGILDCRESLITKDGARAIRPGDFLILVQRRSDLFHEIIRALKSRGLPVAGADRLKIGGELAVRDLTALLAFVNTPEDDLSLAAALRSPVLRLSEGDLYRLAQGRGKKHLWQVLRRKKRRFADALAVLSDLLDQADFLRPYELLERILTRHRGREYLIARLGPEAEDGIDALLAQALQYETMEAPGLTGFLGWMSTDDSDVKRQMDTEAREIRVMTVHGAKGQESPIVILPDTAKRQLPMNNEVLALPGGGAAWKLAADDSPPALQDALAAQKQFAEAERMRVLYVALTRAESWLIVCGAGDRGEAGESWYNLVAAGLDELGAEEVAFQGRNIRRYQPLAWQGEEAEAVEMPLPEAPVLPVWAFDPPPPAIGPQPALKPSDLGGAHVVAGAAEGQDEDTALRHGARVHLLLQHLQGIDPGQRADQAAGILASSGDAVEGHDLTALLAEVSPVLDAPDLAYLFGPGTLSEVGITAQINGQALDGVIDRLVITPKTVLAVDYKSNAVVPDHPDATPEAFLRQLGAYAAALAQIYPDRVIEAAILWTKTARLVPLDHEMLAEALQRAPTS
ncbi:MAG: double-strand break repair helicase AddA [Rhodobacteraceae bacterium]|nr:double-strand break repair helicase AddA [Paracoccaceae bacterium]